MDDFFHTVVEGKDTLTKRDLDEYKRLMGEDASSQGVFSFVKLHYTLQKFMSAGKMIRYGHAILTMKGMCAGDKEQAARVVERLESEALAAQSCPERVAKIQERLQKNQTKMDGIKRVKVKATGRKGEPGFRVFEGSLEMTGFTIKFDGDEEDLPFRDGCFRMDDVTILCEVCDKDADKKCSRCQAAWYCSEACQLKAWPVHKKKCKRIGGREKA